MRLVRGLFRALLKITLALIVVVVLSAAVAIGGIELGCKPNDPLRSTEASLAIDEAGYHRPAAYTYLTFPEWYIVYAFDDFGAYLETGSESGFAYLSQISGFWRSYCEANRLASAFPGDQSDYKLMVNVIGLSFTYELAIKGLYENTIGRLTEWLRGPEPAAEDILARDVVQDYAHFLYETPWYRYPFGDRLSQLWNTTPLVGSSPVRNLERKASLSIEYALKAGYARLIAIGQAATAPPADSEIMFVVHGDPQQILAREPDVRLVRNLPDDNALLVAPRYQRFTDLLIRLADAGVEIVEIAGNQRILMSAIVNEDEVPAISGSHLLFSLPLEAEPGRIRAAFDMQIPQLSEALVAFRQAGVRIEHIYDY